MAVATPLIMTQKANTAVPPLSTQQLNNMSAYIVVGTVTRIEKSEVQVKFGTNNHYKVLIKVERLESKRSDLPVSKGQFSQVTTSPRPGSTIEVHYWKVGKRQGGWSGSQGQNVHLKEGMTAKLFMRKNEKGEFHLLQPNGWQPIVQESVK
jgi:hypothetical protein